MIAVLLALSAASPPDQAFGPTGATLVGEPPIQMTVKGVGTERTISEFMDVCFRPDLNVSAVQDAIRASDFGYQPEKSGDAPESFSWKSEHAYLVLNVNPAFSQCALSIGSNQPRTGEQLLAMLKPVVEAELGQSVQVNSSQYYLQWTRPGSSLVERITLADASSHPKRAIWYVFDKAVPGVREKMESMISEKKSQPE